MLKISNYRPPQIIERDPKESTYEVGDDKFSPLKEKQVVEKYNHLCEELEQAKSRIHELTTYADRVNTELEQVKKERNEIEKQAAGAYYDNFVKALAIERKALELACKWGVAWCSGTPIWENERVVFFRDMATKAQAEKEG